MELVLEDRRTQEITKKLKRLKSYPQDLEGIRPAPLPEGNPLIEKDIIPREDFTLAKRASSLYTKSSLG
jgi:hypothetical protein